MATNVESNTLSVLVNELGSYRVTLEDDEHVADFDFGSRNQNVWQNPIEPLDVNDDGVISPLDALILVNHANANPGNPNLPEPGPDGPPPFLDVSDDKLITALDVLFLVNFLNDR